MHSCVSLSLRPVTCWCLALPDAGAGPPSPHRAFKPKLKFRRNKLCTQLEELTMRWAERSAKCVGKPGQKARRGEWKKQRRSRDLQGEIRVAADTGKVIREAVAGLERKA